MTIEKLEKLAAVGNDKARALLGRLNADLARFEQENEQEVASNINAVVQNGLQILNNPATKTARDGEAWFAMRGLCDDALDILGIDEGDPEVVEVGA